MDPKVDDLFFNVDEPALKATKSEMVNMEKAARELLKAGAPFDSIQAILGKDVKLSTLAKDIFDNESEGAIRTGLHILKKSVSVKEDDIFFESLMNYMKSDPQGEYIDPISLDVMRDPVLLSSGICVDRASVLDKNGKLRYTTCPITREILDLDVFPVKFLKDKITDWLIGKFHNVIIIAKEFINYPIKFEKVCALAETIL